jgi:hypothetical protein
MRGMVDQVVVTAAALLFTALMVGVVAFQLALAAGAPWGEYAMGGAFPGRYPTRLRIAAVIQAILLGGLSVVVLSAAGLLLPDIVATWPWLAWVPVVVSALAVFLNAASRSAGERRIWVPVAVALLVTSLVVALFRT